MVVAYSKLDLNMVYLLQMADFIEVKLYHSGTMNFNGQEPMYVGGRSETIYLGKDDLHYYKLKSVGLGYLRYKYVEAIWYVEPNKSSSEGLHGIRNDRDITNG
ncbi:hypothetical protein LINPERPRIM_LOCUS16845 [Linum perenne]